MCFTEIHSSTNQFNVLVTTKENINEPEGRCIAKCLNRQRKEQRKQEHRKRTEPYIFKPGNTCFQSPEEEKE